MIDKEKLETFKKNLEKQYSELSQELNQIRDQRLEVKGALRFVKQILISLPTF